MEKTRSRTTTSRSSVSGTIAYVLTELAFWAVAFPVAAALFTQANGHAPDLFNSGEDGCGHCFYICWRERRAAVMPLRFGVALAAAPWVDENIVQRFGDSVDVEAVVEEEPFHGRRRRGSPCRSCRRLANPLFEQVRLRDGVVLCVAWGTVPRTSEQGAVVAFFSFAPAASARHDGRGSSGDVMLVVGDAPVSHASLQTRQSGDKNAILSRRISRHQSLVIMNGLPKTSSDSISGRRRSRIDQLITRSSTPPPPPTDTPRIAGRPPRPPRARSVGSLQSGSPPVVARPSPLSVNIFCFYFALSKTAAKNSASSSLTFPVDAIVRRDLGRGQIRGDRRVQGHADEGRLRSGLLLVFVFELALRAPRKCRQHHREVRAEPSESVVEPPRLLEVPRFGWYLDFFGNLRCHGDRVRCGGSGRRLQGWPRRRRAAHPLGGEDLRVRIVVGRVSAARRCQRRLRGARASRRTVSSRARAGSPPPC